MRYFLSGLRLHFQLQSVTVLSSVPYDDDDDDDIKLLLGVEACVRR